MLTSTLYLHGIAIHKSTSIYSRSSRSWCIGINKILVIAPNYTPGTGPSNALYFLKYVNATKILFFKQDSSTYYKDMNMYALSIYNLGINHYVLSRIVKSLVERLRPDYTLSIAPELLLSLEEEVLKKTIVIPQGVLEPVHINMSLHQLELYLHIRK